MADNKLIEIKIDNKEVLTRLQKLASRGENLRPLMKNIAGIFASATEENFKNEGRPDKWIDLSETTKKQRQKIGKYPGQILQVSGQLASSVTTAYDDNSAVIGSNLAYAAIHQLGGQTGKNKKTTIPARPYLQFTDNDFEEVISEVENYFNK
jgi:phage virion morphogenesis protein